MLNHITEVEKQKKAMRQAFKERDFWKEEKHKKDREIKELKKKHKEEIKSIHKQRNAFVYLLSDPIRSVNSLYQATKLAEDIKKMDDLEKENMNLKERR